MSSVMRVLILRGLAIGICGLILAQTASRADAPHYSEEPLLQTSILTRAEVAVEMTRFNNWLNEHHTSLKKEQLPPLREHAYLVIDSVLKGRQAEKRTEFADWERMALRTMFNWGTPLGVYGSALVARHFSENSEQRSPEPLLPTGPFELRLDFPSLTLVSTEYGWRLQVPFYFMISDVRRFRTKDGLDTDLVSLSTSFGQHADGKGRSQATIMFLYAKTPKCGDFDAFWLEQLGLNRSQKTKRSPLPSSGNYEAYNDKQRMRTELTTVPGSAGCYALAYLGIDGTFQANHVSYDDFMQMFGSEAGNLGVSPPPPATQPTGPGTR